MRTDPTDTGGLFVGRRPGTAPTRYAEAPERGGAVRRRLDALLAHALLLLMVVLNLLFWGPIPAGALWIASQVQYRTGSVSWGILLGFCALLASLSEASRPGRRWAGLLLSLTPWPLMSAVREFAVWQLGLIIDDH